MSSAKRRSGSQDKKSTSTSPSPSRGKGEKQGFIAKFQQAAINLGGGSEPIGDTKLFPKESAATKDQTSIPAISEPKKQDNKPKKKGM